MTNEVSFTVDGSNITDGIIRQLQADRDQWKGRADQLSGELELAEEGLASATQEIQQLRGVRDDLLGVIERLNAERRAVEPSGRSLTQPERDALNRAAERSMQECTCPPHWPATQGHHAECAVMRRALSREG